jgi:hypothetical protein
MVERPVLDRCGSFLIGTGVGALAMLFFLAVGWSVLFLLACLAVVFLSWLLGRLSNQPLRRCRGGLSRVTRV